MRCEAETTVSVWRGTSEWHDLVPRLLNEHLREAGAGAVAEVGVWRGDLSRRLVRHCPSLTRLLLVDPWQPVYVQTETGGWAVCGPGLTEADMDEAAQTVQRWADAQEDQKVRILRLPSLDAAASVPDGSLAAVILDALHFKNTVIDDIEAWRPKLRTGGLMIGDDYSEWFPGVQLGVEAIFGSRHCVLGQTWWTYPNGG